MTNILEHTHTPGPWEICTIYGKHCIRTVQPKGTVAETYSEADARLIAAAPELLEAARAVVHFRNQLMTHDDVLEDAYHKAVNAIAKAEGQP